MESLTNRLTLIVGRKEAERLCRESIKDSEFSTLTAEAYFASVVQMIELRHLNELNQKSQSK